MIVKVHGLKLFLLFFLLPVGVCIDAYMMIGSELYLVRVNLLITHS